MTKSILIDATHFGASEPTGVEKYVDALLPPLSQELLHKGVAVSWVGHGVAPDLPKGVEWVQSPYRKGWGQRAIGPFMKTGYSLYFSPSGIVPLGGHFARAMTVHDLSFEHYPKAYSASQRLRLHTWGKRAAKVCQALIVPAKAVQHDLATFWDIPARQVTIVPHGPLPLSHQERAVEGVVKPFILFVGRIETKKNLLPLIKAFEKLAFEAPDIQLVLAGNEGVGAEVVRAAVHNLHPSMRQRVLMPGYVSDAEQAWLYARARVVVVPSPAEGFGFPILHGFMAEVPVIVANGGAAPEVGGDAVLTVAASSVDEWSGALREMVGNGTVRHRLVTAGKERLKDFSWQKAAQETAAALLK